MRKRELLNYILHSMFHPSKQLSHNSHPSAKALTQAAIETSSHSISSSLEPIPVALRNEVFVEFSFIFANWSVYDIEQYNGWNLLRALCNKLIVKHFGSAEQLAAAV